MLACSRKAAKLFRLLNIKFRLKKNLKNFRSEKYARADIVRIPTPRDVSEISIRYPGKSIRLQFTLIPFTG